MSIYAEKVYIDKYYDASQDCPRDGKCLGDKVAQNQEVHGFKSFDEHEIKEIPTNPNENEDLKHAKMISSLPSALKTLEAIAMLDELVSNNILDTDYKPLCDPTEAVVVADCIATKLQIKQHWKPFNTFWGIDDMKSKFQYSLKKEELIGYRQTINYYLDCALEKVKLTIRKR